MRDISCPVVRCAKKPADCPRMWRYRSLRRSITTRWPTSAIRYDDTYEPMPFNRYTATIPVAVNVNRCWFGSTLSKIGFTSHASPAVPTAYTIIPATAHPSRKRYGRV